MNAKQRKLFENLTLTELKLRERNIWEAWGVRSDRLDLKESTVKDKALEDFKKTREYKEIMKALKFHYETYHYVSSLINKMVNEEGILF